MVEGGHRLSKPPNPHPVYIRGFWSLFVRLQSMDDRVNIAENAPLPYMY